MSQPSINIILSLPNNFNISHKLTTSKVMATQWIIFPDSGSEIYFKLRRGLRMCTRLGYTVLPIWN